MKLPFLPIHIDSFVRSAETVSFQAERGSVSHALYFLSHAHTDHMVGLTPYWQGGLIFCSSVTREILLERMAQEAHQRGGVGGSYDRQDPHSLSLADRCVPLPFWQRIPLMTTTTAPQRVDAARESPEEEDSSVQCLSASSPSPSPSSSSLSPLPSRPPTTTMVSVTLLPAFHIPGSAMLYYETPFGCLLYTGDFKFDPLTAAPVLTAFFRTHPVDHVYLDDTWLHLGVTVSAETYAAQEASEERVLHDPSKGCTAERRCEERQSGTKVLSKLLNAAQVEEAVEAIGRRLDAQRRRFARECQPSWLTTRPTSTTEALPPPPPLPFVLRVYLHNQFGKEMLVQRIAERLGTRAMLDDSRFARVATVSAALHGSDIDAAGDCEGDVVYEGRGPTESSDVVSVSGSAPDVTRSLSPPPLEHRRWNEGDCYPLSLHAFVSVSQYKQQLAEIHRLQTELQDAAGLEEEEGEEEGGERSGARAARLAQLQRRCEALPLVEVVESRAKISPEALQRAAARSAPVQTPHYGVVMSGWARLQSARQQSGEVWQMPTTLHCTPQEIIDFVAMLRPLSVTPLHYRPSRSSAVVMQRLGPFLRNPFVNEFFAVDASTAGAEAEAARLGLTNPMGQERTWYGLVALPEVCLLGAALAPGARVRGRDCNGMTADGVAFRGPRQSGFRIAGPSAVGRGSEGRGSSEETPTSSVVQAVSDARGANDRRQGEPSRRGATVGHPPRKRACGGASRLVVLTDSEVVDDDDDDSSDNDVERTIASSSSTGSRHVLSVDDASDVLMAVLETLDS